MQNSYLLFIFLLLFIVIHERRKEEILMKTVIEHRKQKGAREMVTLAERMIGKECLIYAFNQQITGVIEEVTDGAILVRREKSGEVEIVNLDFVMRIREYPRNKNGKKKSVVLD